MNASEQIDAQWIVDHPSTYDSRARKIANAYLAQARFTATLEQASRKIDFIRAALARGINVSESSIVVDDLNEALVQLEELAAGTDRQ